MIVLLLYFFVSGAVLLLGAEINAAIHPAERTRTGTLPGTMLPMIEELGICQEPRRAA
jgi:uncharacterized BrkB/YihY/UPF0761 family membrane protein